MTEKEILAQIKKILVEHGFKLGYKTSFPMYRRLPPEVQLSLLVLEKHGMKIQITLDPVTPVKKEEE